MENIVAEKLTKKIYTAGQQPPREQAYGLDFIPELTLVACCLFLPAPWSSSAMNVGGTDLCPSRSIFLSTHIKVSALKILLVTYHLSDTLSTH